MITREEVLSIEEYCAEHKVTHKARLAELGIQYLLSICGIFSIPPEVYFLYLQVVLFLYPLSI